MDLERLREALAAPGKSGAELARLLGRHPSTVTKILNGERQIKAHELDIIQSYIARPAGREGPARNLPDAATISEIDVRAGMGGGGVPVDSWVEDGLPRDVVVADWFLPAAYLSRELKVKPGDCYILEVRGDSMMPTLQSGDRVIVDSGDRVPSPPGIFALWDGFGVVVKRVEPRHGSDPMVLRVMSDNPAHTPYEISAEEARLLGRVVWRAHRM